MVLRLAVFLDPSPIDPRILFSILTSQQRFLQVVQVFLTPDA
jgi:hypothetical protein